jgi:hypothetical protein
VIDHYSFGTITVNGQEYHNDLIVAGDKVKSWWRNASHEVSLNDLDPILEENPQQIIFGTGAMGVCHIPQEIIIYLQALKKTVKILKTAEAVDEFNHQAKEKNVIGAFHLTC